MRWFAPIDAVSLTDFRQSGCSVVVIALHHIPAGDGWTVNDLDKKLIPGTAPSAACVAWQHSGAWKRACTGQYKAK